MTALPEALRSHFSSVVKRLSPGSWMAQSTTVVMPPAAAAAVPVRKSSAVKVPMNGISKWVCTSMAPGSTYLPAAFTIRGAVPRSTPRAVTLPPATPTSAR